MKNTELFRNVILAVYLLTAVQHLSAKPLHGPDFNGDGKADLVYVSDDQDKLSVEISLSNGSDFSVNQWLSQSGSFSPTDWFFHGDLNGDGKDDLAALRNDGGQMSCTAYLSNGRFLIPSLWATQSGDFTYADKWFKGDFNGDGKMDLARAYADGFTRKIDLYLSTWAGFGAPVAAVSVSNAFHAEDTWLTGDFNGDGKTDFAIIEEGSPVRMTVHCSTGAAFSTATWGVPGEHGDRLAAMKWIAEDFTGDGHTDIAKLWDDNDKVSIEVHRSTGEGFVKETWLKQFGEFVRDHKLFAVDFNGDGKVDIASLSNQNGQISIQSFESTGTAFHAVDPICSGATYRDANEYLAGDFNGDGASDVTVVWADTSNRFTEIILSGKTAGSVSSGPLGSYHSAINPAYPVWGDGFLNLNQIRGAVPPTADLQAVLNAGNDLFLVKNAIYNVSSTLKYKTAYQRIETYGAKFLSDHAILRMQINLGDYDTLIDGNKNSYVHLAHVTVDGNKYVLGPRYRAPGVGQGAMVFFSHAKGVWIRRCIMHNSRMWSTCHLTESGDSNRHLLENNYILGAGVDPRGNGASQGEQVIGMNPTWADGFSISAYKTICRNNFIMDTTDVGIVLFGAPGSKVQNNMIVSYSRGTHGGINLVDPSPAVHLGKTTTFGASMDRYDYRNDLIESNRISAAGARIMIGLPFGRRCWTKAEPTVFDHEGGMIRKNHLEGGAFGYGYVLDYVMNVNFHGNTSSASHSGKGVGTSNNKSDPDLATAFLWDPTHVTGSVQTGFTGNTKLIEDLLWHHGRPSNANGFFFYPYTPEEAEATTQASYWEMLGRTPTPQELTEGKNGFLNNERLYGDEFKRQLMQRPEFIEKFGAVTPANLHLFRTARWRDALIARDSQQVLSSGNYPSPTILYGQAHVDLYAGLTGVNATITSISPALPATLAQGQVAQVAVTVKNTGATAWSNPVNSTAKFALAAVGDDSRFGKTRYYIPAGISVAPGQSYTFHLTISAPPLAYAGEGKPTTTTFPFDFRMMQEAKGSFGESITEKLGTTHSITIENSPKPPPRPFYDAQFVSQKIIGDPQSNGIRPGAELAVEIVMMNTGNETSIPWSKNRSEYAFSLGSEGPRDNRTWGNSRISMETNDEVKPGETATFVAILTATNAPGTYNFQWKMTCPAPGVSWFGSLTPKLSIQVTDSAPAIEIDHATPTGSTVPKRVSPGTPLTAQFTFKNEGKTTWTATNGFKLGGVDLWVDPTSTKTGAMTSKYTDSPAGQDASSLFDNLIGTSFYTPHASCWIQYRFPDGQRQRVVQYALSSVDNNGPGPELMSNPSFENDLSGWTNDSSAIAISTENSRSGSKSVRFKNVPFGSSQSVRSKVPIVSGKTYDISLWYKVPALNAGSIRIDTVDEYDDQFKEKRIVLQTPEWTLLTGRFTAKGSNVTVRIFTGGFDGTADFDDVSVAEVDAGSNHADPRNWSLDGSNDGSTWTTVNAQSDIDFNARGQRRQFAVSAPASYEYYRLTATNISGSVLKFSELELLTGEGIWTNGNRVKLPAETIIAPGQSHTFSIQLTAPATPGTYFLRTRMMNSEDQWFGTPSEKHAIHVGK